MKFIKNIWLYRFCVILIIFTLLYISDLSQYFVILFLLFTAVGYLQIKYSGFSIQLFPRAKEEGKVSIGKLDFTDLYFVAVQIWNSKIHNRVSAILAGLFAKY